ncbi:MAG TPA: hypothetical protein VMW40_04980 [Candidatus Bathyarchaeia archaeon]|nr:hypothetical protein [Candidatus Bathyarchaeia archaeon]
MRKLKERNREGLAQKRGREEKRRGSKEKNQSFLYFENNKVNGGKDDKNDRGGV